jgi:hypothetical protein
LAESQAAVAVPLPVAHLQLGLMAPMGPEPFNCFGSEIDGPWDAGLQQTKDRSLWLSLSFGVMPISIVGV